MEEDKVRLDMYKIVPIGVDGEGRRTKSVDRVIWHDGGGGTSGGGISSHNPVPIPTWYPASHVVHTI